MCAPRKQRSKMIKAIIFGLWFAVMFVSTLIASIVTAYAAERETNVFKFSFYVQRELWDEYRDELNLAGRLIVTIVVTAFIFPANILLFICHAGMYISRSIWYGFKCLFAERRDNK